MVASRKYIKFLFEFAVRGHPKQDGKYEFQDWHPVMMIMILMTMIMMIRVGYECWRWKMECWG